MREDRSDHFKGCFVSIQVPKEIEIIIFILIISRFIQRLPIFSFSKGCLFLCPLKYPKIELLSEMEPQSQRSSHFFRSPLKDK